jgi:hypothetical protein
MAKKDLKDPEIVETFNQKDEIVSKDDQKEEPKNPPKDSSIDLSQILKKIEELSKTNKMLFECVDKRALERYYQRNQKEVPSNIRVRKIDGGLVESWKTLENDVYKDYGTGRWVEKQTIEVKLFNGETKTYNLVDFNRRFEYVDCVKTGQVIDSELGSTILTLKRSDNGEEIKIDVKYVN